MEGDVGDNDGKIFFSAQANGNTIDSLVHFFSLATNYIQLLLGLFFQHERPEQRYYLYGIFLVSCISIRLMPTLDSLVHNQDAISRKEVTSNGPTSICLCAVG
ncbi:hypothetical protein D8M19_04000 [Corynebacterium pseudodiphtheriticum]|nr:hypothetical protein D8M19_04000 [Corynebacterium pseudodiphtheriticum]